MENANSESLSKSLSENINEVFTEVITNISFYSSIIITFSILTMSLSIASPLKGIIYVGWILIATFLRFIILLLFSSGIVANEKCKRGSLPGFLGNYDGGRNSIYVLCFTFFYICFPMFISLNINWYLVWMLLFFIVFDCIIKYMSACIISPIILIGEILGGSMYGLAVSATMYFMGLSKFLFVNDVSSNREVCSVAKNQTFKCSVYKNGEIISTITK
jgi:hypothetical protein